MIELAKDIRAEKYPKTTEELSAWHDQNPDRFLISDGHVTFSLSRGSEIGIGGNFNKLTF